MLCKINQTLRLRTTHAMWTQGVLVCDRYIFVARQKRQISIIRLHIETRSMGISVQELITASNLGRSKECLGR